MRAGYRFEAAEEQFRPPQTTRIALIQHSIVKPTTAPFQEQRAALHARVTQMMVCPALPVHPLLPRRRARAPGELTPGTRLPQTQDAAGAAGAKIVCLQEAWHMPFAFCTREKQW